MSIKFPTASSTTAGLISTGTQTFAGSKTFSGALTLSSTLSTGTSTIYASWGEDLITNKTSNFGGLALNNWSSAGSQYNIISLNKSKSGTIGTHTLVGAADLLGVITATGSNGTSFLEGASIKFILEATPGPTSMPAKITFNTTLNGTTFSDERGSVNNAGLWTLGSSGGTQTHVVNGNLNIVGTRVIAPNGTSTAPSLTFNADTTTGFSRSNANTLDFITGGANAGTVVGGTWTLGASGVDRDHVAHGNLEIQIVSNGDYLTSVATSAIRIGESGTQPVLALHSASVNPSVIIGTTTSAFDGAGNNEPVLTFDARLRTAANTATALTNRNLFRFSHNNTVVGSVSLTGAWSLGPAVTQNYNGQRHQINGGLTAGGTGTGDQERQITIASNFYTAGNNAANNRTTNANSGAALSIDMRTANSGSGTTGAVFTFQANQTGDVSGTNSADVIAFGNALGNWTFGTSGLSTAHTFFGNIQASGGAINTTTGALTIGSNSTAVIFPVFPSEAMIVYATQGAEANVSCSAIITVGEHGSSTPAQIFHLTTHASLSLTIAGLNVQATNHIIGAARTVKWSILRFAK